METAIRQQATQPRFVYVSNHDGASLSVIDLATNRIIKTIQVGQLPNAITISPDGTRVYVPNGGDNSISIVSTETNEVIHTITGVSVEPFGIALSASRNRLYVPSLFTGTILVLNALTYRLIKEIPIGNGVAGGAVTPDESKIYITSLEKGISIIDAATNKVIKVIAEPDSWSLTFSPSGGRYYVINEASNQLSVYGTRTNNRLARIPVGIAPLATAISKDGKLAYVTNSVSNTVSVINMEANEVIQTIAVGDTPFLLSIDYTDQRVYVTNFGSDTVSVIDIRTNQVIQTIPAGPNPRGITITP
ncbi:beta-propeller fold lactonase family protein [Paenibacillus herberti]|uniref:PQQ-dependent protein n=1 Tax=Paenibacillus herberti TaxID=1619309 RepID=A0A229NT50_9BACL|nr:beta-propeller fold lactonase family protein [Paenibacillus herberti]OXM13071.1 hypothetical protein CGZ75_23100 [Paenibacillus herberti]